MSPSSTRSTCSPGSPPTATCWSTRPGRSRSWASARWAASCPADHLANCPATDIALEQIGRPLPNAALIAGFAALTGMLALASVDQAIRQRFPGAVGERNVVAATAAFRHVNATKIETARAAPD